MFCPVCKAEYRQGFTRCADCDVELVNELPALGLARMGSIDADDGDGTDEDPFCSFWKGDDPRVHAELCQLLEDKGIRCKTIRRQDHLFNWTTKTAFEVGVPFSQYDRAEAAVQEAYGGDEAPVAPNAAGPLELPESVEPREPQAVWDPENWYPEDATVEIWEGEQPEIGELLVASLGENRIHARSVESGKRHKLFVLPGDEGRAREIVREVVEGVQPE